MNKFMNGLKEETNFGYTENGAIKHNSTLSGVYDLFAMGGAYRSRSDEECITLFNSALQENPLYAMKCLFYLRDCRGGQGERRFFRVCMNWLAKTNTKIADKNLNLVAEYGRWDDLYLFINTPLENKAFNIIKRQLELDIHCKTPSLLAKWLKSENTSSEESRELGDRTRRHLGLSHKEYRKILSQLRERIRVLETLMSENRWNEIEFDKIPSRAGFIYRNAFARRDIIKERYKDFAFDIDSKVNAKVLYPYECIHKVFASNTINSVNRAMINKYWDNLADYINGAEFNGMAVVDVSGSMSGTPIEVAISLGLYCAEKSKGPYANHFMTFSSSPSLVEVEGSDFCGKVMNMTNASWGGSTNVEAAFDLMLNVALKNKCSQKEIPQNLIIITDMEFDECVTSGGYTSSYVKYWESSYNPPMETLFESIERKWNSYGYTMPHLIFWNVNARSNNIPKRDTGHVSYISGFSPVLFDQIIHGKSGIDLMFDKLNSDRYKAITV